MKSIFDYFTKTASNANAAVAMNEDGELAEEALSGRSKQHHRYAVVRPVHTVEMHVKDW